MIGRLDRTFAGCRVGQIRTDIAEVSGGERRARFCFLGLDVSSVQLAKAVGPLRRQTVTDGPRSFGPPTLELVKRGSDD